MSAAPGPVAVVGGGSIGVAWAVVFGRAGHAVAVHEPDPGRRAAVESELGARVAQLAVDGLLDEAPGDVAARVRVTGDLAGVVSDAVHVQECVPEDLDLKRRVFAAIEAAAPAGAVLASSTSALTPTQCFAELAGPHRALVVHPANPPHLLRVVEVVPAQATDPGVVESTLALLRAAGMSPVRVRREVEGSVFNRLQGAVLREAYCLVRDGVVDVEDVDRVVREGLGRRWAVVGPFETVDLNTRGGIAAHAERLGPAYARMGAERGQDDPWTEELVAEVTAQRRALLPLEDWDARVAWRDRALAAMERASRSVASAS